MALLQLNNEEGELTLSEDEITSYVLNPANTHITKKYINFLLMKYDLPHKVDNLDLYKRATTHTSYLIVDTENEKNPQKKYSYILDGDIGPIKDNENAIPLKQKSYERLEFLGDAIIRTTLADYLYHRYENEDEGFMTRLRTKIEKGEALAKLCVIIGLNKYILMSKIIEHRGGRKMNVSILEDVFEAFIGALYEEVGFDNSAKFIINLVEKEIDIAELLHHDDNYKDMLIQHYHKVRWNDPKYDLNNQSGIDKKQFIMNVRDNDGGIIGQGKGSSKKKGEQAAAKQALIKLGVMKEDSDSESECDAYELSDISDSEDCDDLSDLSDKYSISDSDN